jgi:biotin carboxylase
MILQKVSAMNVLLLSNSSYIGLKIAQCLARHPLAVHAIAHDRYSLLMYSRLRKTFTHLPFLDGTVAIEQKIATINACIARNRIDVVLADDVESIAFLHGIKHRLNAKSMATNPPDLLATMYNKASFFRWMCANDLPTPPSAVLEDLDGLEDAMREVGFPLMVKALQQAGRRGIVRCDTADEVHAYVTGDHAFNELPLVLQRYIEGADVSVSGLAIDGRLIVADALRTVPEDGGIRHYCDDPTAFELADRIVARSGFHGIVNFDLRYDQLSGDIYILECNPRFFDTVAASMWMGINFPLAVVDHALGRPVQDAPRTYGPYMMPGPLTRAWMSPSQLLKLKAANFRHALAIISDPKPMLAVRRSHHH